MTPFQMTVVALCLVINTIDGLDILVIAFTAPSIAAEWGLGPEALGVVFSSGLAGMVLGSLFLAPMADRIGRRPMIMACLVLITIGMLATAATTTLAQLIAARLLTGLGVGAMLPSVNTQVAEYASTKRQSFAISILHVGFVIGGTLGGILAAYLVTEAGWRAVFVCAGLFSLATLPVAYWLLPESLDYLVARRPKNALARANGILARLGLGALDALPESPGAQHGAGTPPPAPGGLATIVAPEYRFRSAMIWISFFMTMFTLYFVLSWTPQILVAAGLPVSHGIGGGVIMNVGGIIGSLVLGFVAGYRGLRQLVAAYMIVSVVCMVAFAFASASLAVLMTLAFVVGFFLYGVMIGLWAVVPQLYPPAIRTTGTGWAIGIGRFGAIAGPYAAGMLMAAGWDREAYYSALSLPLLVAAAAVLNVGRKQSW